MCSCPPLVITAESAYAIGLMATDGCLSPDGRHLSLTSKDLEQVITVRRIFGVRANPGTVKRGQIPNKAYHRIQWADVCLYRALCSLGMTANKSKTLGKVIIPAEYFWDFLRGCIDGDGSLGQYSHPQSRQPQSRLRLTSASEDFVMWIHAEIALRIPEVRGWISKHNSVYTLNFGKRDCIAILERMYYAEDVPTLARKRVIAETILGRVAKLV